MTLIKVLPRLTPSSAQNYGQCVHLPVAYDYERAQVLRPQSLEDRLYRVDPAGADQSGNNRRGGGSRGFVNRCFPV